MCKTGNCVHNVSLFLRRYAKNLQNGKELSVACNTMAAYADGPNDATEVRMARSVAFLCKSGVFYRMVAQCTRTHNPLCGQMRVDCALVICHALEIARRRGISTHAMEEESVWLESIISAFPLFHCVPNQ